MSAKALKKMEEIAAKAYDECLDCIIPEVQKALPEGWCMVLAVGWGVSVVDDAGATHYEEDLSPTMQKVVKLANTLEEMFGLGNEQIYKDRVVK